MKNKREQAILWAKEFLAFLKKATSQQCTVIAIEDMLKEAGFDELKPDSIWKVSSNGKYYVKPYDTMIAAFTVGKDMHMLDRYKIIGSHLDSPGFKVKSNPEMRKDTYVRLNVEQYGSPILNTWLDRNLSLSGMVVCKSDNVFNPKKYFVDIKDLSLAIPNLAIHRNRTVNKGFEFNVQKHLLPIFGQDTKERELKLKTILANQLEIEADDILDYELSLYINEEGHFVGVDQAFVKAPRIDNLAMVFASMKAVIESESNDGINLAIAFDNEEIGSNSKQGADSTALMNIMERIFLAYDKTKEQFMRVLPKSFFLSADGANGSHPNFSEKHDPSNPCILNHGICIKQSSSKKYATDAETAAVVKQLCKELDIETQNFVSRSDMPAASIQNRTYSSI